MKITALVENTTQTSLKAKHGICLYIETKKHKLLFDLGPNKTFLNNAKKLGIDLSLVDTVIISHGHMDHGGALEEFLKINSTANIYIADGGFDNHYNRVLGINVKVSLDSKFKNHKQIKLIDGDYQIDDELSLFRAKGNELLSTMNKCLLGPDKKPDEFIHEHNLLIKENKTVLIHGCGHRGIVNILNAVNTNIDYCIGGYHLFNPVTKAHVSDELLDKISAKLSSYTNTKFYTMHCTGIYCYNYLQKKVENLNYLSCGGTLDI